MTTFLQTESTPLVLDFGNKVFESPVKKHIVLFSRAVCSMSIFVLYMYFTMTIEER